jgi:hypothetical protein
MKILNDSPDKPPIAFGFVIVFVSFIFVFVFWFISYTILAKFTYKIQYETESGMNNKTRLTYIKQQNDFLNSSAQLSNGMYKLPIDEAMDEVIQKANQ